MALWLTYQDWHRRSDGRFFLCRFPLSSLKTRSYRLSYYTDPTTLCLLYRLNKLSPATCSRSNTADGTFYHMMWGCPQIRIFWAKITAFILVTQIPNICNPLRCLLGYIDDESLSKNVHTFLRIVLFYAKKYITMHCKSQVLHAIAFWLTVINQALYKLTRGQGIC